MSTAPLRRGSSGLACVRCGGALAPAGDFDQLRCRYCGSDHLLRHEDDVSAVAPMGRISSRRAHRALLASLREHGIAGANVHQRRLAWLPFWHVRAKLVGWQVYERTKEAGAPRRGADGESVPSLVIRERERVEELVARDLDLSLPACDTRGWGLLGITDRLEHLRLRPFAADREAGQGMIGSVVVPHGAAQRRAQQLRSSGLVPRGAIAIRQRLSLVRVRTRLVYYPVWKLRYTVQGVPGEADVDGIRGVVLRGDAPLAQRSRAPQWLAAASIAGWLAGLHPALGIFGLASFALRRGRTCDAGTELDRWGRWLGEELDPRPVRSTTFED